MISNDIGLSIDKCAASNNEVAHYYFLHRKYIEGYIVNTSYVHRVYIVFTSKLHRGYIACTPFTIKKEKFIKEKRKKCKSI